MATFVDCCVLVIPFLVNFCAGQVTAISFTVPSSGDIRLRDGGSSYGRVEIFYNGQWGRVCDDYWDMPDAAVVCRQLGFAYAVAARQIAAYVQGEGDIWLDDVQCLGNESSLADCEHSPWGEHNCYHAEDAGVQCSETTSDAEIRLRGGGIFYGRVEIMYGGLWGTVCDDYWDMEDATVVCRQLGFDGAAGAYGDARYGQGVGQIWLDDVQCGGYEYQLSQCPHNDWGQHNCEHREDAGVECINVTADGEIRLRGGSSYYGRVEIKYGGLWGTVCDDDWDMYDATVVCRQLGFDGAAGAYGDAHYSQGIGQIWLDDVQCRGYEYQLSQCPHNDWGQHNCEHREDAGVECIHDPCPNTCTGEYDPVCGSDGATYYNLCEFHAAQCDNSELTYLEGECDDDLVGYIEGDIRLVGDSYTSETERSPYRGTIEVYHNGRWGTVCDDDWDIRDARVACRQLGFPAALEALYNAYYGPGSGPISLDEVRCSGNEQRLVQCNHDDYHECTHPEDAGVGCEIPDEYYPRLVGGYASYEGRLEVWNDTHWKRRCDYNFNPSEATVVCRQLGFEDYSSIYHSDMYSGGGEKSPPFDAYFICGAHDWSLYSCSAYHITLDQSSCFSVSIRCQSSGKSYLSTGAIIGITVGAVFGVVCLGAIIVTLRSAKKIRNQRPPTIATISGGDTHTATVRPLQPNEYALPSYNDVMHNPMTYPYPPPMTGNPAYPPPKPVVAHPTPPQYGLAGPPAYPMQTNVTYQPES